MAISWNLSSSSKSWCNAYPPYFGHEADEINQKWILFKNKILLELSISSSSFGTISMAVHLWCNHWFSQEATITMSKRINEEDHIFAILLILVLAPLFCPSLDKEELRGVKRMLIWLEIQYLIFHLSTIKLLN